MTAPRERPILFSGPMVRALLAGTKTQTRRLVKGNAPVSTPCPYGSPDDRLWVRETFAYSIKDPDAFESVERPHSPNAWDVVPREGAVGEEWVQHDGEGGQAWSAPRWLPGIFMPRWGSRITLEVTDVRVEQLQKISEEDAQAEGVAGLVEKRAYKAGNPWRDAFAVLWDKINGKRAPWAENPWVWAISFRRLK